MACGTTISNRVDGTTGSGVGGCAAARLAVFGLVGWDLGLEAMGVPGASEAATLP